MFKKTKKWLARFFSNQSDEAMVLLLKADETENRGTTHAVKAIPVTYEQSEEIRAARLYMGARAERKVIEEIERENRKHRVKRPYTTYYFEEWPIKLPGNEVISLAPNQYNALKNMRNYGSKQQVQELLEVYERANEIQPLDEQKAVRVTRAEALNGSHQFKGFTR